MENEIIKEYYPKPYYPQYIDNLPLELDRRELITHVTTIPYRRKHLNKIQYVDSL